MSISFQKFTAQILTAAMLCSGLFSSPATMFAKPFVQTPSSTFVSEIQTAPQIFTGLGASWDQAAPTAELSVRFQQNSDWSVWYALEPDLDGKEESDPHHPTAFLPVNPSQNFQYKISGDGISNLQFTYTNSTATAGQATQKKRPLFAAARPNNRVAIDTVNNPSGLHIISRAEWGADESLRVYKSTNPKPVIVKTENDFETKFADELKITRTVDKDPQGKDLTWPQAYPEKISKIIIHHTATTKTLDDPMRAIRDIYYFHTVSRGWGDIGYNYIIDQQGNIYEGRAGGDGVVGAHAGRANIGSIGIAVLGNYMDSEVPEPVIHSLVTLIQAKTQQYNIDSIGSSMFRGENLPNVLGHRDVMSTSCPGEKLYAQLSGIRLAAKSGFKALIIDRGKNLKINQQYDFTVAQDIPLFTLDPGEEKELVLSLKNSGPTAWNKDTQFIVNHDANAEKFFINDGIVHSNLTSGDVQPGETATFTVKVRAGYKGGFTALEVFPMINGKMKVEKYLSMPIVIKPAILDYEMVSPAIPKTFLKFGDQLEVRLELKNTGNITWQRDGKYPFVLGSDRPRDHQNTLLLKPSTRLAKLEEKQVQPGQTGHFNFKIKAPKITGSYKEYFTPLIEGVAWFENKDNAVEIYAFEKELQGFVTAVSKQTTYVLGEQKTFWFDLKNIGGIVWNKSGDNSISFDVRNNSKLALDGPTMDKETVAPGETAHISFTVTIPSQPGYNLLQIKPKIGGCEAVANGAVAKQLLTGAPASAGQVPGKAGSCTNYLMPRAINYSINIPKTTISLSATPTPVSTPTTTVTPPSSNPVPVLTPPATITTTTSLSTNIRIGLEYRGNPTISGSGPFHVESESKTLASFTSGETATVTYTNNQYSIKTANSTLTSSSPPRFVPDSGTILKIQNWTRSYNQFRGILEPHWYNNELITINELPIEDYLKGTGETKDSQPYEKLKAVMVVSRSYALFYVTLAEKFPGAPFHLKDDPQTSQKYVGYGAEKNSPNTLRAIADTSGEVVTYNGKLIKTPYFSADDGRTRSAQEVWGWKDTPYLASVPDPYCKDMVMSGHGVGLSGCGSLGMAQAGKTYQEIIKYYYTGVEIKKL